jgi:hypothetical protein
MGELKAQATVKVYPNPAANVLHVSANHQYQTALIIDLSGKLVKRVELTASIDKTIDLSALPQGYYLLKLTGTGVAPATTKFVKQ